MKRLISLLCTLTLVLAVVCPPVTAFADEGVERVIHVVYDDSGSMCEDKDIQVDRWSQALYAMEVFATMLGDEDEMKVYRMNDSGAKPIEVEGDDPNRVEHLVSSLGTTGNTPFATVEAAVRDLLREDADKERWLVVLTDGIFQPRGTNAEARLKEYAAQGLQVMYLAIDSSSTEGIVFTPDPDNHFYAYDAVDSDAVLERITQMANQIFQQQKMPASHIKIEGNTVTVDADIPLKQLLVFAQGENITVSDMKLDGNGIKASEEHQVSVTEANTPPDFVGATICADGLSGVVSTYGSTGKPYASGKWSFSCSDTSNLEIYYIAGAEIDCHLTYNGVEVKNDEKHYAGEYGVSMRFLDPLTGKELKSDLLDGAVFTARITNGEDVKTIDASQKSIYLKQGEVELSAWAELPGNVTVRSDHRYTVYPEPKFLSVMAEVPGGGYKISALGPNAQPIIITVSDKSTGKLLTQEEWNATNLSVSGPDGVKWLVEKGTDVATWQVRPDYITDMTDTFTGSLQLTVKADYEIGTQAASGAGVFDLAILPYTASELKVDILPSEQSIPLNDLGSTDGAKVVLYTKDEYTGEFVLLTPEQAKVAGLTVEAEGLNWDLAESGETGTWLLKPRDDLAALAYGDSSVVVVVSGTLKDGMLVYEGSDSERIAVTALTLAEKIARVIGYVVAGVIIILLLIGYLGKKKLRLKNISPYVENVAVRPRKRLDVKYSKVWWSYLLPYVPQRATFSSHQNVFNCRFANVTIKAAGGAFFYIVNIRSFVSKNTKIDGEFVDAKADKKKKFSMSSTISSLDAKTKRPTGEFHFV